MRAAKRRKSPSEEPARHAHAAGRRSEDAETTEPGGSTVAGGSPGGAGERSEPKGIFRTKKPYSS